MANVAVTVHQASKYTLRWKDSACWAVFFVDEETYCLTVMSDYGDYAYRWGQPGESFKKFLTGCDRSYVMGKLQGGEDYFDHHESMKKLEKFVKKLLKKKGLTSGDKDEIQAHLEEIKSHGPRTNEGYSILLMQGAIAQHTNLYDESSELFVTGPHPWLISFMDKIWPEFVKALKEELAQCPQESSSSTTST